METEYALVGRDSRDDLLQQLVDLMARKSLHLPSGRGWDMFLENGSRFYVDCGGHPEMSTPECSSPYELVRYIHAGEALLADLMDEMASGKTSANHAMLFRCNVDYSGAQTTWGSHESYLHSADPKRFPHQLIPHLVSRVIYTGAGGFNPFSPGMEFTLSPRSWHLHHEVSPESTSKRGIFHTKDETLSRTGTHRLHLLCGESLCSELATWLRVGTTALVVALIDAGLEPGTNVRLKFPLKALHVFAGDPSCRSTARLIDERCLTALEIQHHYLTEVECQLTKGWLPHWAKAVCRQWRAMLDRIESDPDSLSSILDWAIKYAIYRDYAARRGIDWNELPPLNHVAKVIHTTYNKSEYKRKLSLELILDKTPVRSPIRETIQELKVFIEENSLTWDLFRKFWNLKQELLEVDMRFGQIGEDGIFNRLDHSGVLDHRIPGIGSIDRARTRPPVKGRAHVRGCAIRRYSGRMGYECYWDHIRDLESGRIMDFSDPFASRVQWKKMTGRQPVDVRLRRRLSRVLTDLI